MSKKLVFLTVLFTVCLIASNLFEIKIFTAFGFTLTGGLILFPISYIINDILTEIYGLRNARFAIFTAFSMNLFVVLTAQLVKSFPPAPFWDGAEHFNYVFTADLRITIASMSAFLVGSLCNSFVMDRMKQADGDKKFGVRAITSTVCGETIDSLIFFPIAFWSVGVGHLLVMMLTQIVLKTLYEIMVLPVTSLIVRQGRKRNTV